jgi:hypothetical protein
MAPSIQKVREALSLRPDEAARLLHISTVEYLAMETEPGQHFTRDQLKTLWNWMTPKMTNHAEFMQLIDQP